MMAGILTECGAFTFLPSLNLQMWLDSPNRTLLLSVSLSLLIYCVSHPFPHTVLLASQSSKAELQVPDVSFFEFIRVIVITLM